MTINTQPAGFHTLCQPIQLAWRFVSSPARYPRVTIAKDLWKTGDTFKRRVTNVREFWQFSRHPALKMTRQGFQALQVVWKSLASLPPAICQNVQTFWQKALNTLRGMNIPLA